eukprot:gene19679-25597_t
MSNTITLCNEYVVQYGDTLAGIALREGTTISSLKKFNRLSSDQIFPGMILITSRKSDTDTQKLNDNILNPTIVNESYSPSSNPSSKKEFEVNNVTRNNSFFEDYFYDSDDSFTSEPDESNDKTKDKSDSIDIPLLGTFSLSPIISYSTSLYNSILNPTLPEVYDISKTLTTDSSDIPNIQDIETFYRRTKGHINTLLFIHTLAGDIFGGFVNEKWKSSQNYYGSGESFVFRLNEKDQIDVFNWTGSNNFFMWSTDDKIAMGGGGDGFAFVLDNNFISGETCSSATYGNISQYKKPALKRAYDSLRDNPSISNLIEVLFKVHQRGSNIKTELFCGLVHFLSVASVLAVNPAQLSEGGYIKSEIASGTAISVAVTCILTGLFGNLPFVSTPTLATSIYLSAFMKNKNLSPASGNAVVLIVGICIGLSILVALTALVRLGLVKQGYETILTSGDIWTLQVIIAMASFIAIASCQYYGIAALVLLAGLSTSLASLAGIEKDDGAAPRSRWLYFACGIGTIFSSVMGSGPVIPSSESAIAIASGARTGLSAVVCGLLFILSAFCYPIWANIPIAGTGPVFLMVGVLLFENTKRVNWDDKNEVITVFITAIFASLTDSIFHGVIFGSMIHLILLAVTGRLQEPLNKFYDSLAVLFTKSKEKSFYNPVSILELTSFDAVESAGNPNVEEDDLTFVPKGANSIMEFLSEVQSDKSYGIEGEKKHYQAII